MVFAVYLHTLAEPPCPVVELTKEERQAELRRLALAVARRMNQLKGSKPIEGMRSISRLQECEPGSTALGGEGGHQRGRRPQRARGGRQHCPPFGRREWSPSDRETARRKRSRPTHSTQKGRRLRRWRSAERGTPLWRSIWNIWGGNGAIRW